VQPKLLSFQNETLTTYLSFIRNKTSKMLQRNKYFLLVSKCFFGKDDCEIARWAWTWVNRTLWEEDYKKLTWDEIFFGHPGVAKKHLKDFFDECLSEDDYEGLSRLARLIERSKTERPFPNDKISWNHYRISLAILRASYYSDPPSMTDVMKFLPEDAKFDQKTVSRLAKNNGIDILAL
jgi:hypothetical protein